jgi:bis(5'-nucleosyl)-tetraphosphatase (symmetrical)
LARYAIGDVQGCCDELVRLLTKLHFSSDRDELWFVGDLVNRGPDSLGTLRLAKSLHDNAVVVLGNHDLHLLAVALGGERAPKRGDTLDDVLRAPDRSALFEWLVTRPLAHYDSRRNDLLIHAGLVPAWSASRAVELASTVESELRNRPEELLRNMYGNKPDRWKDTLTDDERTRFVINTLTRLRFCTADGRVDLKQKNAPSSVARPLAPWFDHPLRASRDTRVVFGHWSTLGFMQRDNLLAIDTGCVWGGALTAVDLDDSERPPIQIACSGYRAPGEDGG